MKKYQFKTGILTALASVAIILSACKKDDPEPTTPTPTPTPTVTSSFSAKLNGAIFNETLLSGIESTGAATIAITASRNGGVEAIGLAFPNTIAAGTYTYDGSFGSKRGIYNLNQTADGMYSADSGTGSLVITSHDLTNNVVSGTFNFVANPNIGSTAVDSHSITEGAFTIQY